MKFTGAVAVVASMLGAGVAVAQGGCDNGDGALADQAFVIVTAPAAGARVSTGFTVTGCSRSFEATVLWKLMARDGTVLAEGVTAGGGVDGPGDFAFAVDYAVEGPQIAHLRVYEEDMSEGEGYEPGRTVLPLILRP